MRNICMISQSPYPFDPRVRRQAEKLARSGFEIDILCLPLKNEPEVERFGNGITAYRILKNNLRQDNVKRYLWLSARFFFKAFFMLRKLHKKRGYILIQIHNMPEIQVFTTIFQKLNGVPVLLDIHDLTPELMTSKWGGKTSRFLKPVTVLAEKLSCGFSNHIITVTEGCKEILSSRSAPPEKISLILNTADTSIFPFYKERKFKRIEERAVLLYHGTVAERFGLHIIIEALPYVLEKIPDTILRVYGKYDPDYKILLEKRIFELNLSDNVTLGDNRTHEELYDIMNESDIEVVPYIGNEYMNLSLSTKAFECASAGLPIIATNLRTMRLTFNDDAVKYAEDRNPQDFAEKIIELCYNPQQRRQMVKCAHNSIMAISGDVMEERYLRIIEKLTGFKSLASREQVKKKLLQRENQSSERVNE